MQISIATRVSLAFAIVLGLALLILGAGLAAGSGIRDGNIAVASLSRTLQNDTRSDRHQRRLRLDIGDATRNAEHGVPVSDARWAAISHAIDNFETRSRTAVIDATAGASPDLRAAMVETRASALAFAPASRALIRAAQSDGRSVKQAMPRFLGTLKRLEAAHIRTREVLVDDIDAAVRTNAVASHRSLIRLLAGGVAILAVMLAMTIWLHRHLLSPIEAIAMRLRAFSEDARVDDVVPGTDRRDELGELARGLAGYRSAVEARRSAERRAHFLAHHDMLTGAANRLLFETRLASDLAHARETGGKVAVFAIDLDCFKAINDRYGHGGGDRMLKRVATLLTSCIRDDDLVARLGGDEFAIIQASPAHPGAAESLVNRLFAMTGATESDDIPIRMSIGVAISTGEQDGEELYDQADLALYDAKSSGRNMARFFDTGLQERLSINRTLADDLAHAAARDQFSLVFQPIADTATLAVGGYEALLRWRHPDLGDIAPDRFIPIAEIASLIDPIGLWVADKAFAAAASWPTDLSISLNVSPVQLRRREMPNDLLALARRHGIDAARIRIEITESAALTGRRHDDVARGLRALQSSGVTIVVDDFGTGQSSLRNLKDFLFDELKIDRGFIAGMLDQKSDASIVKAIIGLAQSLGLTVVAEGVETEEQLDRLRGLGCDKVQGYLIGRPLPLVMTDGRADISVLAIGPS